MFLPWIHDQLRWYAQAVQGLVHLLASNQRDIEVLFTTHEECRRGDLVGVQEGIRNPDPGIEPYLPGCADLFVVLNNVLVDAIESDWEGCAGPAGRPFEAMVLG